MKRLISTLLFVTALILGSYAQDLYYLIEDWEDPVLRSRWSQTAPTEEKEWKFTYGGQDGSTNPEIPKQGSYNAGLYRGLFGTLDTVKLVSPFMELEGSKKPTLRFWHCQYESILGQDFLRILFRSAPSAEWEVIQEWTNNLATWYEETYDIETRGLHFLTDSFQIAFEGIVGPGYGVYVDSITVKEDTILQKYVKSSGYELYNYTAIPSGARDVPVARIKLRIFGNEGNSDLKTVAIEPTGAGISALETTNFKLFYSEDGVYRPFLADTSTHLSTASLSAGKITFTGIGADLQIGDNYLFVTANIKDDVVINNTLGFQIPQNGISFSDTLFPSIATPITGTHDIRESVFYDDFESGTANWTFTNSNFQVGMPQGNLVTDFRNPSAPFNGSHILATDTVGGYTTSINPGSAYYAYSDTFDLSYYINTRIYMHRQFAFINQDSAVIDITADSGATWENIWFNSPEEGNDNNWREFILDVSEEAKYSSGFAMRFGMGKTNSTAPRPGFGIDNFAILSEKLSSDVGITQIIAPYDDCLDCGNDSVKIIVRNYADSPTPGEIPVLYGIDGLGGTLVYDTIRQVIGVDDSVTFTFAQRAIFSQGDYYNDFTVSINLSSDQDPTNNTLFKPLIIQNNDTPPHREDFEFQAGMWIKKEGSTFTNKEMNDLDPDPLSPHVWVVSPFGPYPHNDDLWVTSGCYDLSDPIRNVVQFKHYRDCEYTKDGARLEYSRDGGATWNIVDDPINGPAWGWMVDTVEALGSRGFTGLDTEWKTVKAILPVEIDTVKKAKFRVRFMSDAAGSDVNGFAFNDFEIYPAPHDVGVSKVLTPVDACQGVNDSTSVTVRVKNYGYNTLKTNDTLIVGIDFQAELPEIDTIILASDLVPGDSIDLEVNADLAIRNSGTYNITAYTLIEDDPWFYNGNNDTATYSFDVWPNPITELVDTIFSREPDTVVVRPYAVTPPGYTFLWFDGETTDYHDVTTSDTFYSVRVTEPAHSCYTDDSVFVRLLFSDIGVNRIISPDTSLCEATSSEIVEVELKNFGSDSLYPGDKIYVYYQVDGGTTYVDSTTLTDTTVLYAGETRAFRFESAPYDFSAETNYNLKTWAYFGGDTVRFNDTSEHITTVHGYTPLELGNDTIINGLTHTIDAGSAFETYWWSYHNDPTIPVGDSTSTLFVDASVDNKDGDYSLIATDINNCPSYDTVNVSFVVKDLRFHSMISPFTNCDWYAADSIAFRMVNGGTQTISDTDTITWSYKINADAWITEKTLPTGSIAPNAQISHIFKNINQLRQPGTYNIIVSATVDADVRPLNDTNYHVVVVTGGPDIDFGPVPNPVPGFQYLLDAGAGPYTYLWQDGMTTTQTYLATESEGETFWVVATDTNTGCPGGDTVTLAFDITDFAVTAVTGLNSVCQYALSDLTVEVSNMGIKNQNNITFKVGYDINGGTVTEEEFFVAGPWEPGESKAQAVVFADQIEFDQSGENTLNVYVDYDGDMKPGNDEHEHNVNVLVAPLVDFGGDTVQMGIPGTLDPGEHSSYEWQDGFTGRFYNVTSTVPAIYTVKVRDEGNDACITEKGVYVEPTTGINDYGAENLDLTIYPNPASEFLSIELEVLNGEELFIEIYSITNQLMWQDYHNGFGTYKTRIDINGFNEGVYMLRMRNKDVNQVRRFIIH